MSKLSDILVNSKPSMLAHVLEAFRWIEKYNKTQPNRIATIIMPDDIRVQLMSLGARDVDDRNGLMHGKVMVYGREYDIKVVKTEVGAKFAAMMASEPGKECVVFRADGSVYHFGLIT